MTRALAKRILVTALAVFFAVAVALSACTPSAPAPKGEVYRARLSYHWFPTHHSAMYAEKFAQYCREQSKGRLEITTYPSGQLYSIRDAWGAVSSGAVELAAIVDSVAAAVNPNFGLLSLSWFFADPLSTRKLLFETEVGKRIVQGVEEKSGVKFICFDPTGPVFTWTTNKPCRTPGDFRGQKARYLGPSERFAWEALGVTYVSVSTEEIYTALQNGMINTLATVSSAVKAYSWWDFLKFVATPAYTYSDAYIVANARWFNSLPPDIQEVITKVSERVSKEATEFAAKYSQQCLDEFVKDHGGTIVKLTDREVEEFRKFYEANVWPKLSTSFDPNLWAEAQKLKGR